MTYAPNYTETKEAIEWLQSVIDSQNTKQMQRCIRWVRYRYSEVLSPYAMGDKVNTKAAATQVCRELIHELNSLL